MDNNLAIIVLAAGQGTRMKSATPKILHPLAGAPIIAHVLATARALDAAHVVAVVRHERDLVAEAIETELPGTVIVDQDDVPGTGRAVEQAVEALPADFTGEVLVLNGDVPLLNASTLTELLERHRADGLAASVLSARYDDPSGYGRIVRGDDGSFDRIVEQKDATEDELAIDEVNAGVYAFGVNALRDQLANLTTENAQGEKYLTDVIEHLRAAGSEVKARPVSESCARSLMPATSHGSDTGTASTSEPASRSSWITSVRYFSPCTLSVVRFASWSRRAPAPNA